MRFQVITVLSLSFALSNGIGDYRSADARTVGSVRHIPPAEAEPGEAVEIVTRVSRGWEENLQLRYRPIDSNAWQSVTFTRRDQTTYVASIPVEAVTPPGFEYFIMTTGTSEQLRFASSESPHRVNVFRAPVEVRRKKHLDRHGGKRAYVRLGGELVDYGTRTFDNGTKKLADQYLRVDGEVGYRMLNFPLKALSFGYTYLVGETPQFDRLDDGSCDGQTEDECSREVGFRISGWFQLRFLVTDDIEIDARGVVLATPDGFNVGGRGELRVGESHGTHVGLGTEILADVGVAGWARLGWGTVPGFPMAATVEVTNFPAPNRATAIRLMYDVSRPFSNGFRLGARLGYQARDQQVGGISLGLNSTLEF